jgi:hypothetical protein
MMSLGAIEERRKKTTLRKIERKHAGRITQPYKILESLIADVEQFRPLAAAKIIIVWKSGWKPTKDDILKHAQIRKLSELEREIWGDEYDLCMLLHRELWQSARFTDDQREQDVFHELLHVTAEIDDKTGDQKKDDRGRLCWRLRNHPIQRFPEEIERYGLEAILHLDEDAKAAAADEESKADAIATENDEGRPLLAIAGGTSSNAVDIETMPIVRLVAYAKGKARIAKRTIKALEDAGIDTIGKLAALMREKAEWWHKEVDGVGRDTKGPLEDAIANVMALAVPSREVSAKTDETDDAEPGEYEEQDLESAQAS